MAKRAWLCAAMMAALVFGAGSGAAQTVIYEKNQAGHWVIVPSEGNPASAGGGSSATHPAAAVAPTAAATANPVMSSAAARPAVSSAPAARVSRAMAGVAVAAIVPPSAAAEHTAASTPAAKPPSPALPASAASAAYPGALSPGQRLYYETRDSSPANSLNWSVHVNKSAHHMEVYYKGRLYKTYHAVFGRSLGAGAKEWEGDMRTPEGDYLIVAKRRSRRFRWFLALNYPNAIDRARFAHLRAIGEVPGGVREGGEIGIHGTEMPLLNVGDINWTTGCISVDNSDISELERLLPVGTLVVINP
jgi:lipoprotein-anchoring transpeptidase ErfK/SrfK